MANLRRAYCSECGATSIIVDDGVFYKAKDCWSTFLRLQPDNNGIRQQVLEEGPLHKTQDVEFVYNSYGEMHVSDHKSALDYARDDKQKFESKYGDTNYLGLPIHLTIETRSVMDGWQTNVVAKLLSNSYNLYKDDGIIPDTDDEPKCEHCGEWAKFYDTPNSIRLHDDENATEYLRILKAGITDIDNKTHNDISVDKIDVKQYLKCLLDVSGNIMFLEQKIRLIFEQRGIPSRKMNWLKGQMKKTINIDEEQQSSLKQIEEKISTQKAELKRLESGELNEEEINTLCRINGVDYLSEPVSPTPPQKPAEPQYALLDNTLLDEPQYPTLKKPGFFNKDKVFLENQKMIDAYNKRMEAYRIESVKKIQNDGKKERYELDLRNYNEELKLYESKLKTYQRMKDEYERRYEEFRIVKEQIIKEEKRKIRERTIPAIKQEISVLEQQYEDLQKDIDSGVFIQKYLCSDDTYITMETQCLLLNNELNETAELLKEQYKTLEIILEPEIVYPKYDDVVAWSTMYEYFQTGRVTELGGPNGAYNLYENELRSNIIISKLDIIISQLESIKSNQFALYQMLNQNNKELGEIRSLLNDTLLKMDEIKSSNSDSQSILTAILATEQGIAYNTAKTAEYARISARATSAIAFIKMILG